MISASVWNTLNHLSEREALVEVEDQLLEISSGTSYPRQKTHRSPTNWILSKYFLNQTMKSSCLFLVSYTIGIKTFWYVLLTWWISINTNNPFYFVYFFQEGWTWASLQFISIWWRVLVCNQTYILNYSPKEHKHRP